MTSQEKIALIARTDPFKLFDEVERLKDALQTCRELRKWDRNAAIEECAQVAEDYQRTCGVIYPDIAGAIRAKKDKP